MDALPNSAVPNAGTIPAMTESLTIRPPHSLPSGQVAVFEVVGLCLPGGLLVFLLLAHEWWSAGVAFLLLVGLIIRYVRDWSRTAITVQSDQIIVRSPYGFRRAIPVGEVDGMLRAGSNVYFLDKAGKRLGAFPAGIFTISQIETLAAELGVEVPA